MLFWCDLKFEKGEKELVNKQIRTCVDRVKMSTKHDEPSVLLELTTIHNFQSRDRLEDLEGKVHVCEQN